jgi:hypothetical protein
MAYGYQYTLHRPKNGGWLVRFPGIPEALTEGETKRKPARTPSIVLLRPWKAT